MLDKDTYSKKDSNHNRIVDQRERNRYVLIFIAAIGVVIGMVLAYSYFVLPSRPVNVVVQPREAAPKPAAAYGPDEAKPYDTSKPPYEQ